MMSESATRSFLTRVSSRKFLATLAVQVAGLVVLFAPSHGDAITAAAERIAAIAALLLAALGYVDAEARLDEGIRLPLDTLPSGEDITESASAVTK